MGRPCTLLSFPTFLIGNPAFLSGMTDKTDLLYYRLCLMIVVQFFPFWKGGME